MIFLLIFFTTARTHVHVSKILLGNWTVDHNIIHSDSNELQTNSFNISFLKLDDTTLITKSSCKNDTVYKLIFHEGGVFDIVDDNTSDEIAEIEFFHPLFPHASANGCWKRDSIFVGELISDTSMSLSIFNQNSKITNIYSFSKDINRGPESFFEANFTLIVTILIIGFRFILREFKKRKAELELKKQSENDMKKFMEEEEANENNTSTPNEEEEENK